MVNATRFMRKLPSIPVVPAKAGTHTPCSQDTARSVTYCIVGGYGPPPSRGRQQKVASSFRSRQQCLHLLLVDVLDELVDQPGERHWHLGMLGEFQRHVHVLLRPFTSALAPARERPIGAAAMGERLDQARDVDAELFGKRERLEVRHHA